MQFVIERAKACDAEAILAHLNIVGRETDNLTFGAEGFPMSAEQERELLAAQENAENWAMLVAKAEGQIIGLANFRGLPRERMKHRGEMAISVCRAAWGQGVGSALMERSSALPGKMHMRKSFRWRCEATMRGRFGCTNALALSKSVITRAFSKSMGNMWILIS